MNDRLKGLADAGVSIWLDDLSRGRLTSGNLGEMIDNFYVSGVTTNPTIFQNAIGSGIGYGERIADCAARGLGAAATIVELTTADVADACDVLAGVFESSGGRDGRVSIEVSRGPELVAVPDVRSADTPAEAAAILRAAGLVPGTASGSAEGSPIGTSPGRGTMVAVGSTVNIVLG